MFRIIKPLNIFLLVLCSVVCLMESDFSVSAYEVPQDIHISIEMKEIDIEEIPDDRVISLDIYTESCPPYIMLSFLLEKDSRLEYQPYNYLSDAGQVSNMSGMNFEFASDDFPDIVLCSIPALSNEHINYNGLLVRTNVVLPENVSEGDFYSVNFKRTFSGSREMGTSIVLENNFDAVFDNNSFSLLEGGGIFITSQEKSQEEMSAPERHKDYISEDSQQQYEEMEEVVPEAVHEETVSTEQVAEEITAEITSSVTSVETTAKTETIVSQTTETVTKISSLKTTATVSSTKAVKEKNKKDSINKQLIIAVAAVLVSVAATVIIINKKRK